MSLCSYLFIQNIYYIQSMWVQMETSFFTSCFFDRESLSVKKAIPKILLQKIVTCYLLVHFSQTNITL